MPAVVPVATPARAAAPVEAHVWKETVSEVSFLKRKTVSLGQTLKIQLRLTACEWQVVSTEAPSADGDTLEEPEATTEAATVPAAELVEAKVETTTAPLGVPVAWTACIVFCYVLLSQTCCF